MPKFFQTEIAAYGGEKNTLTNVKFKKGGTFENSSAAETGTLLEIIPVHIKNPPVIQFIAYLDSLKDDFKQSFTEEQPYGRTDSYYIWKSSQRSISVSWSIPSTSISIGLDNLNNLSWFLAALYPTYKDTQTATSIAATPMFRVRYANLISSPTANGQGALCIIKGANVTHDHKEGFIGVSPRATGTNFANIESRLVKAAGFESSLQEGKKILIPKLIKINCTLDIVHDHKLGWDFTTGEWRGGTAAPGYPYNFGLIRDTQDPPGSDAELPSGAEAAPGSTGDTEAAAAAAAAMASPSETPFDRAILNIEKALALRDTMRITK